MPNKVYNNLERLRSMMATKSTTEIRPDVGISGGTGKDTRGTAEGYLSFLTFNAPSDKNFNTRFFGFAVMTYIDFISNNDYRLFKNSCQRYVLKMMGDNKRQHRHSMAIVRIALYKIFKGELTDKECAKNLHGRNLKTGREGVSRQVYATTYKPYVEELETQIRRYLETANQMLDYADQVDKLDYLN